MGREEARVMAIVKQFAEQEKASLKRQRLLESRKKQREQERPAWISKMMEKMQKAPTFYPTMEQFQTPQEYIGSISADGAKYGACKIVPPAEFTPQIHRPEHAIATKHQQVLVRTECLSHSSEEEGGQKKIIGTAFQTSHKRNHRSYTIEEYEKIALRRFQEYFNHKDPPPDEDTVESEFWYTTSTANNVSMQYANDVEGTACGPDFGPFRPSELPGHAGSPLGLDTEPMPVNPTPKP